MRLYPFPALCYPFAGSGTTLVQANELGIASVGYDVSAFNILLMRAKTQPYDLAATRREVLDILSKVEQQAATTEQLPLWDDGDGATETSPVCESQYLADWYAPQALHELLSYRDLIANYATQDLLRVILSRAARSARLTTHFDLDFPKKPQREPYWCYKHSRTCKPTTTAIQFLRRYSMDALERIAAFATLRTAVSTTLIHGDVLESAILPADGVVTSPPYVGLIDLT